jgi:hypothetical protein
MSLLNVACPPTFRSSRALKSAAQGSSADLFEASATPLAQPKLKRPPDFKTPERPQADGRDRPFF